MSSMKVLIEAEFDGVGPALKRAREAAGLSLTQAGLKAGMSGSNFNRIENEESKGVPLETLIRAAEAVDLDLAGCLGKWVLSVPGVELGGGNG